MQTESAFLLMAIGILCKKSDC